jgi:hypothetical protein
MGVTLLLSGSSGTPVFSRQRHQLLLYTIMTMSNETRIIFNIDLSGSVDKSFSKTYTMVMVYIYIDHRSRD